MPTVLRAAVTAKRWLAKENKFATSIMEESVDNLHVKCGKHMFNNNFGGFRDFSSDFICGIANKMYLCSAILINKALIVPSEHRSLLHIMQGLF